ncbi:2-dehydro-3-deoxygalactonokinase [Devosia sp. MC521]|uniref:2-dehydro-3-deoxygalactonokinase n=1 Tax=Devosia sp. MC521 TaxID=2759954 RepID=UPI0015F8E3C3|nr:2-dehydro-3-deoxygalactonokinase [Devosia sp. MC521]MBJ6986329.1 2-dehydro-3-deoxygalactonokinase [Devosia sp. MC521]QMW64192.1 2-dehydro-3-deoxygalactonokinase [Devosia sp. MC521]
MQSGAWVTVDWGTSNLRAWALDGDGSVIGTASSDKGMGKLTPDAFPGALTETIGQLGLATSPDEVLICGMAGARQGWLEAPYLEAPTDLKDLAAGAVHPEMAGGLRVSILPGVCQRHGSDDVMRGEETQLLGLAAISPDYSGLVCMPGTHSKWAKLSGTKIESFSTAMTGEMFDLLKTHSVLRHSLQGDLTTADRDDGFVYGASKGLEHPENLIGQLFAARASALLSGRSSAWCAGYLSGLLIGSEIAANRSKIGYDPVPLIGSHTLCALYARVLGMTGASSRIVNVTDVMLAGLKAARTGIAGV